MVGRPGHRKTCGVDVVMISDKQRALAMEPLGNDQKIIGIENAFRAHNRVQSAKSGVVEINMLIRNARFQQIALHRPRFIVGAMRIVAAEQKAIHFALFEQLNGRIDAVHIVVIQCATEVLTGAQHHGNLKLGDVINVADDAVLSLPAHPAVDAINDDGAAKQSQRNSAQPESQPHTSKPGFQTSEQHSEI